MTGLILLSILLAIALGGYLTYTVQYKKSR